MNIGQRKKKGQTISIIKASPLNYKSIRQAVFFTSESDDDFVINHIKTQIEFGDEIEQLCATEFQKIVQEYEDQRTQAQQTKMSESITEQDNLVFTIEDMAINTAWKLADGQISFNKSSKVYNTIENLSEDGIDLFKRLLTIIPQRQINQVGKQLETTFGGYNVQQAAK